MQNTVEIEVKDAQSQVQNLIGSLNQLTTAINNAINTTSVNKLKTGIEGVAEEIDKMNSKSSLFKKVLNFSAIAYGAKKVFDVSKNIANSYIEMIETNNLFEVALGRVGDEYGNIDAVSSKYYLKAMEFQDKMNEKLATNKAELKQYQAMYYSMLTAQGIDNDSSYLMSESLTKAGYDIASLYNLDIDEAMKKLQSGLAGQVKSLRDIGIDVSESAIGTLIENLGIERSVDQLTYAEKEVARYIAILKQAGKAQGDFAKTFENPANQIRVFKNQLEELKQIAGSFITNAFGNILVYINAVIMAIKEVLKFFATLFGFDLELGGSTNLSESIGTDDVATDLDNATGSAKKLKNVLMGFDEINNITLPSSSGASASGTSTTGIDDKLLDALKEWDNKMNSISGKAQEYRDKILETLGFTKDINGELTWSFKNMNTVLKVAIGIAGIVAGITLIGKITKLATWLKTLFKILTTGKGAVTTFGIGLQTIVKFATNTVQHILNLIQYTKLYSSLGASTGEALTASFGKVWASIGTGTKMLAGTGGLITSCVLAGQTMQDLSNGTIGTGEAMLKLAGSIAGATASGAMIGSVFGPVGTIIGALAGAVISATTAFLGYNSATEKMKDNFGYIGESATNFITGIETATSHLDSFNSTLFASSEEQQKLQENMNEIQQGITEICKKASDERRDFTEEEIQKLDEYFAKLRDLKNREIEIQNQIAVAITQQAITNAETFQGSLDEYKQQSQEWIKTAEEQANKTLETIREGSIQEIALLNQRYGDKANMQNEAYANEYNEIIRQRDEKIKIAQEEISKVNEAYANGYLERNKQNDGFYATMQQYNSRIEEENLRHNEEIARIEDNGLLTRYNKNMAKEQENYRHEQEEKKIWKQLYKNMSEGQAEQLGIWLAMITQTEMYGGEITVETQEIVDGILASYNSMPKGTKQAMENAMKPMLEEMEKKEPSLFAKATSIANGILGRLQKSFDIHSPSRKTREMFKNVMLGMELGIEDEESNLYKKTNNISEEILSNLDIGNTMKKINQGIKVNTKDFSVDANSYIDYGKVSGNIKAQSSVAVNGNIIQGIAEAVGNAMRSAELSVNIEAKTEEGVIVKKASQGFKEYVRQTGELPFPVPV